MDALAAVGLVSSIITFVDFSWGIISGTRERWVTGGAEELVSLDDIEDELETIKGYLKKFRSGTTRAEKSTTRLAGRCQQDAELLIDVLKSLTLPGTTRNNVWASLRVQLSLALQKKQKITELRQRLQEYRAAIIVNLNLILTDGQSSVIRDLKSLQTKSKEYNLELSSRMDGLTQVVQELQHAVSENTSSKAADETNESLLSDLLRRIDMLKDLFVEVPIQHRVLRQLAYPEMDQRRRMIHSGCDTCGWIVDARTRGLPEMISSDMNASEQLHQQLCYVTSQNFVSWLKEGRGIFHITGKAGAGKSMLMKFIAEDQHVGRYLQDWAGEGRSIVVAAYYFWTGTEIQTTLQALYRSLLFQVLKKFPELMKVAFPHQVEQMRSLQGDPAIEGHLHFKDKDIIEAFSTLFLEEKCGDHKFCFFIDGLDESKGHRLDHENFARQLKTWTTADNLKICTSSRPFNEFLKILSCPTQYTVHLHLMNQAHIRTYCLQRLENDEDGKEYRDRQELAKEIAEAAEGVFLWAHLVVEQLLVALKSGMRSFLREKIKEIPTDLDQYYGQLFESMCRSESDRRMAFRMLSLATVSILKKSPFAAIVYSWVDGFDTPGGGLQDPNFPPEEMHPYTDGEVSDRIETVSRRIDALTRGFLQLETGDREFNEKWLCDEFVSPKVVFSHRTAADYLLQTETRLTELRETWPSLCEDDVYWRVKLASLGFTPSRSRYMTDARRFIEPLVNYKGFRESINKARSTFQRIFFVSRCVAMTPDKNHQVFRLPTDASFAHFAASLGCVEYIRDQLTLDASFGRSTGGCDFIVTVSAYLRRIGDLRLLLEADLDLQQPFCLKHMDAGLQTYPPIWVVAFLNTIPIMIGTNQTAPWKHQPNDVLAVCEALYQHYLATEQNFSIDLVIRSRAGGETSINNVTIPQLRSYTRDIWGAYDGSSLKLPRPCNKALVIGSSSAGELYNRLERESTIPIIIRKVQWQEQEMDFSRMWMRVY